MVPTKSGKLAGHGAGNHMGDARAEGLWPAATAIGGFPQQEKASHDRNHSEELNDHHDAGDHGARWRVLVKKADGRRRIGKNIRRIRAVDPEKRLGQALCEARQGDEADANDQRPGRGAPRADILAQLATPRGRFDRHHHQHNADDPGHDVEQPGQTAPAWGDRCDQVIDDLK